MADSEDRIRAALEIAVRFGQIDGAHHKMWVIDQMVRALTGCPRENEDCLGESTEYTEFIQEANDGDDGPDTYEWDVGIAP